MSTSNFDYFKSVNVQKWLRKRHSSNINDYYKETYASYNHDQQIQYIFNMLTPYPKLIFQRLINIASEIGLKLSKNDLALIQKQVSPSYREYLTYSEFKDCFSSDEVNQLVKKISKRNKSQDVFKPSDFGSLAIALCKQMEREGLINNIHQSAKSGIQDQFKEYQSLVNHSNNDNNELSTLTLLLPKHFYNKNLKREIETLREKQYTKPNEGLQINEEQYNDFFLTSEKPKQQILEDELSDLLSQATEKGKRLAQKDIFEQSQINITSRPKVETIPQQKLQISIPFSCKNQRNQIETTEFDDSLTSRVIRQNISYKGPKLKIDYLCQPRHHLMRENSLIDLKQFSKYIKQQKFVYPQKKTIPKFFQNSVFKNFQKKDNSN